MSQKINYINLTDINELQTSIMKYVESWVRIKNTPIPQKEIFAEFEKIGVRFYVTRNAVNALLRKGYIRKAYTFTNKTSYVQLRSL
jgi:predicted GNAT superfamily acetyltransferase